MSSRSRIIVRETTPADFPGIIRLTEHTYPGSPPWTDAQLASHRARFAEGQFVAADRASGEIVGMAASLIVLWDDYEFGDSWRDFTAHGTFANHDPSRGRTLYGAEVMVSPARRGSGIGKALYKARRELTERLGLLRIRAGARLRGFHKVAHRLTAEEYVQRVVSGRVADPTLSFQLRQGFTVLGVVPEYLRNDPESLGWAAVIEWLNRTAIRPGDPLPPDSVADGAPDQRGTMPPQRSAPGGSGAPKLDTTTRPSSPGAPGTTANSVA